MAIDINRMATAAIEAALEDQTPERRRLSGLRAVILGAGLAAAARVAVNRAPDLPKLPGLPDLPNVSRVPDMVRDRLAEHGLLGEDEDLDEEYAGDDLEDEAELEPEDEAEVEPDDEAEPEDEVDVEADDQGDEKELEDEADVEPEAEADEEEPDDGEPEGEADEEEPEAEAQDEEPEGESVDEELELEAEADEGFEDEQADDEGDQDQRRQSPGAQLDSNNDRRDGGSRTPDVLELLNPHAPPPVLARAPDRRSRGVRPAARPPRPPRSARDEESAPKGKGSRPKSGRASKKNAGGS